MHRSFLMEFLNPSEGNNLVKYIVYREEQTDKYLYFKLEMIQII
jgi:hypothetical protein